MLFVPGITSPDYCLTTSPSLPQSFSRSLARGCSLPAPWVRAPRGAGSVCVLAEPVGCFETRFWGSTPSVLGSEVWAPGREAWPAGLGARSSGRATAKLAQLLPEPACLLGAVNDRLPPPRGPQRRHAVRSRQLAPLGSSKNHFDKSVKPRFAQSRPPFPASFVILPVGGFFRSLLWGLWSFTRWTLGSRLAQLSASAGPDNFSWPVRPAQLGWRARLLPWFSVQMETQRWPRRAAEDAGSGSRVPGWGRGTRRTDELCTVGFSRCCGCLVSGNKLRLLVSE